MTSKMRIHRLPALLSLLALSFGFPALAQTAGGEPAKLTRQVGKTTVRFHFAYKANEPEVQLGEELREVLKARLEGTEPPPAKKVRSEVVPGGLTKAALPIRLFDTLTLRFDTAGEPVPLCTAAGAVTPGTVPSRQEVK